jgi:hypothetical protein
MKIFAEKAREIIKFGINPKQERNEENHTTTNVLQTEWGGIIRTCEKERECGDG